MNWRFLAALAITWLLIAATVLFTIAFFNSSPESFDSLSGKIQTFYESRVWNGESRPVYVPGEVVIKFKREAAEGEIAALRVGQGAEEIYASPFTLTRVWKVPPSKTVEEWIEFFRKHPLVEYAEPNYYFYSSRMPNDPLYALQWHFDNKVYGGINLEKAWDMVTGNSRVVVAVIDTGVAYKDNVAPSYWHIDTYQAYSNHSWWCGVSTAPYSWTLLYGSKPKPPGYGNGWKEFLQHAFDLRSASGTVTLSYQYRYHLENDYDFAYVEVSSDGGINWVQLKSYTGPRSPALVKWRSDSVDLSGYKGKEIFVRFRVYSDEIYSDEDGVFNSDGAFFVDNIELKDSSGRLFYDDVESGPGLWETTRYVQAPDFAGTRFWVNLGEVAGNGLDDDGNGFVDDVDGWDFINWDAYPNDDNGHGTHVAGTIGQTTNNGLGVAGVAFGVTIMPVKVLDSAGVGTLQTVADGIMYAVNNGADIINLSLGASSGAETLENAVAYAYNNGVTVFAASGNGGLDGVGDPVCDYPAAYDGYVIAVGATQYNEVKAPYSNYGPSLDLVAPGGNTGVDLNGDGYADGVLQNTFGDTPVDWAYWFYQGTSMATPHVSGVAALLLSRNPNLTPDMVRGILQSTAEDLGTPGRDNTFGWGLINAEAALRSLAEPPRLMLTVEPLKAIYSRGQRLTMTVTVFNEMNPAFESSLALTVTGSGGYYYYDFEWIAVAADEVKSYVFSWTVPDVAGVYFVEVSLVPAELTAYDAVWLRVS